jgi:hypothetical protein
MPAVSLTLPDTEKERLMGEEFNIENLQKWLNQGEKGLPYVFFALFNQMNTNQEAVAKLLQKQDTRIEALETCLKDVKPIVDDRKSLTWLKGNVLGVISFVTTSVNFYLLLKLFASKP